jgi:RimJ/RimL family protein N-acetyltransferase
MYPRERIETERLVLVPMTGEQCAAILAGDLTVIVAGEGWPMEDSLVNMRTAAKYGVELPGWFVTLDGAVIGDISTHGDVDDEGDIEVGYNLAEPYRGRRYASEFVTAASQWLLRRDGVQRVVARHVEVGNLPSRKALERAGFVLEKEDERHTWYVLTSPL